MKQRRIRLLGLLLAAVMLLGCLPVQALAAGSGSFYLVADRGGELLIAPELVNTLEWVRGKRTLPLGEVSVSYVKQDGFADFVIRLPEQVSAHFSCGSCREFLHGGENRVRVALSEK